MLLCFSLTGARGPDPVLARHARERLSSAARRREPDARQARQAHSKDEEEQGGDGGGHQAGPGDGQSIRDHSPLPATIPHARATARQAPRPGAKVRRAADGQLLRRTQAPIIEERLMREKEMQVKMERYNNIMYCEPLTSLPPTTLCPGPMASRSTRLRRHWSSSKTAADLASPRRRARPSPLPDSPRNRLQMCTGLLPRSFWRS